MMMARKVVLIRKLMMLKRWMAVGDDGGIENGVGVHQETQIMWMM